MAVETQPRSAPPTGQPPGEVGSGRRKRPVIYYGYWLVGVALLAQFVSAGTQTYVAGVFLKPMTTELDWTRAEFTYAQTAGRFIMAFAGFFVGTQVDKGRARSMMIVGVTILGASLFATSEVTELWQWVVLRGVGFTVGASLFGNLVVNVTLSKWWVEKRGRMVGISSMGVSLAGVILPPLLTIFVDEFGWRAGWRALGVMAWVLVYPASLLMRSTPEEHGLHPDGKTDEEMASPSGDRVRMDFANSLTRSEALRTPALYMIVLAFGFSGVGLGTMLLQTIPFATDAGFDRSTASFMLTLLAFPAAFTKPLWGAYMDFVPEKVAAATSFVIAAIAMVIIVIGGETTSLPLLAVGFFLVGTGIGGQIPIQETIWATYFGRRYLGQVRSVALPFALFLGAGGPLVVSIYFDIVGNYNGAFFGLGVLWGIAALLVLMVRRPNPPPRLRQAALEPPTPEAPPSAPARPATPAPTSGNGSGPSNGAYGANGTNGVRPNGVQPSPEVTPTPRAAEPRTPEAREGMRQAVRRRAKRDYMNPGS
ncbi:MAG: MFS transporter [Dehalococcoidia bacterium]